MTQVRIRKGLIMKKLAFVIPWYGKDIPGGAENALRGITTHLHKAGVELEILTTCVKEFSSDWNVDYYPEGMELVYDIPVRRFKVRQRNVPLFDSINLKLIQQNMPEPEEEEIFMEEMVNSPALYEYIRSHEEEYSWFVYIPYMFGTTYYGIQACPEKAVMIPCFHDESYVYMDVFKRVFPMVRGFLYHSAEEMKLANRVYDLSGAKQLVLGDGIDTDWNGDANEFRKKFCIKDPFILYAGRKDTGKQVHVLLQYFEQYKKKNNTSLKLVLIGGGEIAIPEGVRENVIDLGFVEQQDKYNAYAAAEALCQPSLFESFSIVIMESWIAGRPVLVNKKCTVTDYFVQETKGGFSFDDYHDFETAVNIILENKEEAERMGERGRQYVLEHFEWNAIVKKLITFFKELEENK